MKRGTLIRVKEISSGCDTDSDFCSSSEEVEEIEEVFDLKFSLSQDEIDRLHEAFNLLADPFTNKLDFYELAAAMNS